jgi:choline dehydrogenase-like flavoprotein
MLSQPRPFAARTFTQHIPHTTSIFLPLVLPSTLPLPSKSSRETSASTAQTDFPLQFLDYRSASNPIDMTLHLVYLRYLRKTVHAETLSRPTAVEVAPGEDLQTDEQLIKYIRAQTTQPYMHPCCTTAMLPLSQALKR